MIKFTIRVLNLKVVRYFFSAASATVVDVVIYFLAFNYIYHKEDIHLPFYTFSAPTASLALSYTCGLITNFFLTKNLVFKESDLKGHHQFLRFVLVAIGIVSQLCTDEFFNSSVTLVSYHLTCIFCSKHWCIKFYCT